MDRARQQRQGLGWRAGCLRAAEEETRLCRSEESKSMVSRNPNQEARHSRLRDQYSHVSEPGEAGQLHRRRTARASQASSPWRKREPHLYHRRSHSFQRTSAPPPGTDPQRCSIRAACSAQEQESPFRPPRLAAADRVPVQSRFSGFAGDRRFFFST